MDSAIDKTRVSRTWTSNYIPEILWGVITCTCPWYLPPGTQLCPQFKGRLNFSIRNDWDQSWYHRSSVTTDTGQQWGAASQHWATGRYRQTSNSNISHTKSQHFNVSRLVLQLSLSNPMKPGVNSKMKMQLGQHQQAMLQLHLSDQQFYCLLKCHLYQCTISQRWILTRCPLRNVDVLQMYFPNSS